MQAAYAEVFSSSPSAAARPWMKPLPTFIFTFSAMMSGYMDFAYLAYLSVQM